MSEDQDLRRGTRGVVASLVKLDDGRYRLVLDDVSSNSSTFPQDWKVDRFFNHKDFDARLVSAELEDAELAGIGFQLVVRLAALEEVAKRRDQDGD